MEIKATLASASFCKMVGENWSFIVEGKRGDVGVVI